MMYKFLCYGLFVMLVVSCKPPQSASTPEKTSALSSVLVVRLGMETGKVLAMMKQAGYKDISSVVGIKTVWPATWWIGPDNTCVMLTHNGPGNKSKLKGIKLGEHRKGYQDKFGWLAQHHKDVSVYTLRIKRATGDGS